ncbi:glycine-rich domain-containing protein [Streptomyces sp. NPDC048595]|uniref:glycine-rich domain-containing protein n=1 Tax=Streptomyces sp. NPDC048595 TaxID=3365576 RepID=UPI003718D92F
MHDVRGLLAPDAFRGVVATVMDNNPGMDEPMAGRVVDEALKFVVAAAKFPATSVRPSRVVDEGWHALILHTALYAELCARLGRFVHHYPDGPGASGHGADGHLPTVALIEEAGFSADKELWPTATSALAPAGAKCRRKPHPGGGCGTSSCGSSCGASCGSGCGGGGGD